MLFWGYSLTSAKLCLEQDGYVGCEQCVMGSGCTCISQWVPHDPERRHDFDQGFPVWFLGIRWLCTKRALTIVRNMHELNQRVENLKPALRLKTDEGRAQERQGGD